MNQHPKDIRAEFTPIDLEKFLDPSITAKGDTRAFVGLDRLETLWINTGTLCNITCKNCYINSSPTNDDLVYFSLGDAEKLYDEVAQLGLKTYEIGFTGGEPFMNLQTLSMMGSALERGFNVLVLTNAMQPMMRKKVQAGLIDLKNQYGDKLSLRVSLDHYSKKLHEEERGPGSWQKVIEGLNWLSENGFNLAIAGRTCWGEFEGDERAGYAKLITDHNWPVEASNPAKLILFPEMDEKVDIPEITTACWGILGKAPSDVMCATSRMVVKRKSATTPQILPCTLLPYDAAFEMGETIAQSLEKNGGNFSQGAVKLNHPHCAKFCVLGGGSCTA